MLLRGGGPTILGVHHPLFWIHVNIAVPSLIATLDGRKTILEMPSNFVMKASNDRKIPTIWFQWYHHHPIVSPGKYLKTNITPENRPSPKGNSSEPTPVISQKKAASNDHWSSQQMSRKRNPLTFHYTGCLMGILAMVYDIFSYTRLASISSPIYINPQ